MATITIPEMISYHDWVCDLNISLPTLSIPVPDKKPDDWWSWAYDFINTNGLSGITVPDKNMFPKPIDWKTWAYFFMRDAESIL